MTGTAIHLPRSPTPPDCITPPSARSSRHGEKKLVHNSRPDPSSIAILEEEEKTTRSNLKRLEQVRERIFRDLETAKDENRIAKNRDRINKKTSPFPIENIDLLASTPKSSLLAFLISTIGEDKTNSLKKLGDKLPKNLKDSVNKIDNAGKLLMIPYFLFASAVDGLRRATTPKQISDTRRRLERVMKALEELDSEARAKKIRIEAIKMLQEPGIDPD